MFGGERIKVGILALMVAGATFGTIKGFQEAPVTSSGHKIVGIGTGDGVVAVDQVLGNVAMVSVEGNTDTMVEIGKPASFAATSISDTGTFIIEKIKNGSAYIDIKNHARWGGLDAKHVLEILGDVAISITIFILGIAFEWIPDWLYEEKERKNKKRNRKKNPYGMNGHFYSIWEQLQNIHTPESEEYRHQLNELWKMYRPLSADEKREIDEKIQEALSKIERYCQQEKNERMERIHSFAQNVIK